MSGLVAGVFPPGLWPLSLKLFVMSVVKINAITVPTDSGDELARRFAARAGAVDNQDGFEGFELLKPADERTTWLVVTRWRDEESFQAWLSSPSFGHGHRTAAERSGDEHAGGAAAKPVGMHSELWSYETAGGSVAQPAELTLPADSHRRAGPVSACPRWRRRRGPAGSTAG